MLSLPPAVYYKDRNGEYSSTDVCVSRIFTLIEVGHGQIDHLHLKIQL